MTDYRSTMEHDLRRMGPAGFTFTDLVRRRDRKRRNERIATAVLALILAAAAIGSAVGVFRSVERRTPADAITPENVKDLELAWTADLGGPAAFVRANDVAAPVVADGTVFVASRSRLSAYAASCASGGAACRPSWVADVAGPVSHAPVVADGVVYLGTDAGYVYAFPASCGTGGATCKPSWIGRTAQAAASSPVVADSVVWVSDLTSLYAFDCAVGDATCAPHGKVSFGSEGSFASKPFIRYGSVYAPVVAREDVFVIDARQRLLVIDARTGATKWVGSPTSTLPVRYRTRYNSPVVSGNAVYATLMGRLYSFPLSCGTGGTTCRAIWSADVPDPYVGRPLVSNGTVYVGTGGGSAGKAGHLLAFATDCASGGATCDPRWIAATPLGGDYSSIPLIVAGDVLYATSRDTGTVDAYSTSCGGDGSARCPPLWKSLPVRGPEVPTVAGDLVFVTDDGGGLSVFGVVCAATAAACPPVWSRSGPPGVSSAPVESGAMVFTLSAAGELRAFGLGSGQVVPDAGTKHGAVIFYVVLLASAGFVLAIRNLRRRT